MSYARAGDVEIYYELHGPRVGAGRAPAVLVMGLGSDANAWEKQIAALAGDRPVLVLDNRGVGRSGKPRGPYSTALLADDLALVMDAAGIQTAHVAGISLGGMIAQELALRRPERVRSLALLATFARADAAIAAAADAGAVAGGGGADLVDLFARLQRGAANVDFFMTFAYLTKLVFSPEYLRKESLYLQSLWSRTLEYGLSIDGLAGQVAAALAHDTVDRLGELRAPTLVALGTADALIPPPLSRDLAAAIPGARLVEIENGSHGLNLEAADLVNKLLRDWFFANDQGEYTAD